MRALIFDRDGVINHDSDLYIKTPKECVLIEGIIEALRLIPKNTHYLFIASNQAGLAKGILSSRNLAAIHQKIFILLKNSGIFIEGIFFCPHFDISQCDCRKPKQGLLTEIFIRYPNLVGPTPFLGDSERDLIAGELANCVPVLVLTGNGKKTFEKGSLSKKVIVIEDLQKGLKKLIYLEKV